MTIRLYFDTVRYLKPEQLWYQLKYRFLAYIRNFTRHQYRIQVPHESQALNFHVWIDKPASFENHIFTFLNLPCEMQSGIQWNEESLGLLWCYNLNYMDFILQEGMEKEAGLGLIASFMDAFSDNRVGKHPYPISLRGINWIKFLSLHQVQDAVIASNLYAQYLILSDNIEYHLCGNHLLENGLSLLFGAFYFGHERYYMQAKKILDREIPEQILADGAHFEQSPMYQLILLDRVLDCVNLLQNKNVFKGQDELLSSLSKTASKMLAWLNEITYRDGEIPLFNDSTLGIAPSYQLVSAYSERLSIEAAKLKPGESGFRCFTNEGYELKMSVGNIMAAYIPGHSHADTFGFELRIQGEPILVDTGISTYEKNQRRQHERGTAAHNTVQYLGLDSSQVWGGFRVALRARVEIMEEGDQFLRVRHSGYKNSGVLHERRFAYHANSIEIVDVLSGKEACDGIARFHFHPQIIPEIIDDVVGIPGGKLSFKGAEKISVLDYDYAPGFNKLVPGKLVEVCFRNRLVSLLKLGSGGNE